MIGSSDFRITGMPLNHGVGDIPVLGVGSQCRYGATANATTDERWKLHFDTSITRSDNRTSTR